MDALVRFVAVLTVAYVVVCAALYLLQGHLIFFPRSLGERPQGPHVEAAAIERADVTLRGWIVNGDSPGPLLIYFGGNAEELSWLVDVFTQLDARTVLINYRGYGDSEGSPSAAALIADARAVVRTMRDRLGADRPLILFGRSLGSGIAAQAAAAADVDGLVLMSPYRTLTRLAARQVPFVPVRWLLRHRIDAAAVADRLPPRILVLYGVDDLIIPAAESRAFVALLPRPPRIAEFDAGHNVPLTHPDLWPHIVEFVSSFSTSTDAQ